MLNPHSPLHRHKQSMLQSLCLEKTTLLGSHCSIPEPLTNRVAGFIPGVGKEWQKVLLVQSCPKCTLYSSKWEVNQCLYRKMGYGGAAYTRLHNSKMHQDQSSDPLHVFPGKMQRGLWWQYPSLGRLCFFFFWQERYFLIKNCFFLWASHCQCPEDIK